jgi:ectoine hydroxylase-related dioxygenase (phytanoyl-CoA dioxygenase family)
MDQWAATITELGFAMRPDLFSADCIDQLISELTKSPTQRSRAGLRHALGLASVSAFARQPIMLDLAQSVMGPDAFPFRATLFDKSPDSNWLVVWHQDTALPLCVRTEVNGWGPWSTKGGIPYAHAPAAVLQEVLALRVSLDASTNDNGPLRVLPRTHTLGVLTDDAIHDLSQQIAAVDCLAAKGGVVAMRPLAVHASSKSRTDSPRRVLHIEYAASASIAGPLRLASA